jgi:hypothetical protein
MTLLGVAACIHRALPCVCRLAIVYTRDTHIVVWHFPCRFLFLENNQLSGPIPGTIGSLVNLQ